MQHIARRRTLAGSQFLSYQFDWYQRMSSSPSALRRRAAATFNYIPLNTPDRINLLALKQPVSRRGEPKGGMVRKEKGRKNTLTKPFRVTMASQKGVG